ncbi:MAG TPA: GyrI-like domain-containing protein [Actinomycetaceae bacterium]|nr:GyrI-like domain-containing protein [Actinomycetaceae bacterium]
MSATKVDFTRALDTYRARRGEFRVVEVPETAYLMVDGHGDPNTDPSFAAAVAALYPVAYRLKFASKEVGRDYVVPPLEGLWWAQDLAVFTTARDTSRWEWTLMLMVPDWLEDAMVEAAIREVGRTRRPERLDDVRLGTLTEGTCLQTLHVGPFDDEGPVLATLHQEVIPSRGLRPVGRHHEIYLSDFRRVPPANRRTILRQPVRPA